MCRCADSYEQRYDVQDVEVQDKVQKCRGAEMCRYVEEQRCRGAEMLRC